jgi:hypothetical protein
MAFSDTYFFHIYFGNLHIYFNALRTGLDGISATYSEIFGLSLDIELTGS